MSNCSISSHSCFRRNDLSIVSVRDKRFSISSEFALFPTSFIQRVAKDNFFFFSFCVGVDVEFFNYLIVTLIQLIFCVFLFIVCLLFFLLFSLDPSICRATVNIACDSTEIWRIQWQWILFVSCADDPGAASYSLFNVLLFICVWIDLQCCHVVSLSAFFKLTPPVLIRLTGMNVRGRLNRGTLIS